MLKRFFVVLGLLVFIWHSCLAETGAITNASKNQPKMTINTIEKYSHWVLNYSFSRTVEMFVSLVLLGLILLWIRREHNNTSIVVDSISNIDKSQAPFLKTKEKTIIKNLRSGDLGAYTLALTEIPYLPFGSEAITKELSLAVGAHGEYRKFIFLDSEYRCKTARFLHLLLERSRSLHGNKPWPKVSFDLIFYDCSFCKSIYPQKPFWRLCVEMLTENIAELIKKLS